MKESNYTHKNNEDWQSKMFKLYMTHGWGGPDFLPVFKLFIIHVLNH